jgi:hypothetical protein
VPAPVPDFLNTALFLMIAGQNFGDRKPLFLPGSIHLVCRPAQGSGPGVRIIFSEREPFGGIMAVSDGKFHGGVAVVGYSVDVGHMLQQQLDQGFIALVGSGV